MNECTKRGCRKLKLQCEDCGRVASTCQIPEATESEWMDITKFPPPADAPCEYRITVSCRGWYKPDGDEARFAPDDRVTPESSFCSWRHWKAGETFDEAVVIMRKLHEEREKSCSTE